MKTATLAVLVILTFALAAYAAIFLGAVSP